MPLLGDLGNSTITTENVDMCLYQFLSPELDGNMIFSNTKSSNSSSDIPNQQEPYDETDKSRISDNPNANDVIDLSPMATSLDYNAQRQQGEQNLKMSYQEQFEYNQSVAVTDVHQPCRNAVPHWFQSGGSISSLIASAESINWGADLGVALPDVGTKVTNTMSTDVLDGSR